MMLLCQCSDSRPQAFRFVRRHDCVFDYVVNQTDSLGWGPNAKFRFPRYGGTGSIWKALYAAMPEEKFKLNSKVCQVAMCTCTCKRQAHIKYWNGRGSRLTIQTVPWLCSRHALLDSCAQTFSKHSNFSFSKTMSFSQVEFDHAITKGLQCYKGASCGCHKVYTNSMSKVPTFYSPQFCF